MLCDAVASFAVFLIGAAVNKLSHGRQSFQQVVCRGEVARYVCPPRRYDKSGQHRQQRLLAQVLQQEYGLGISITS